MQGDGSSYGPGSVAEGSSAAFFNDYDYSTGVSSSIVSEAINLSMATLPKLDFYYWDNSGSDFVEVFVSTNGTDFTSVYTTPTEAPEWENQTVDLSIYEGYSTVYIKFTGTSTFGYSNPHIDNVVIYDALAEDALLSNLNAQLQGNLPFGSTDVVVDLVNYGVNSFSACTINYSIYDETNFVFIVENGVYNWTGTPLNSNESITATLTNFTSVKATSYLIAAEVVLNNDANTSNNTILISFDAEDVFSLPFAEGFSAFSEYWSNATGYLSSPTAFSSTTSEWDFYGTNPITNSASTLLNLYTSSQKEWMFTPFIDLGTESTILEFDLSLTLYDEQLVGSFDADDKFAIIVSTDGGNTWSSANEILNYDQSHSFLLDEHIIVDLSAYSGIVKLGFYAESTNYGSDNNLYIDNISVRAATAHDLAISSITDWAETGNTVIPKVSVENLGINSESVWSINLTDGNSYNETLTNAGVISLNSLLVLEFPAWNPSEGTHSLTATLTLAEDGNLNNNTFTQAVDIVSFSYDYNKVYSFDVSDWTDPLTMNDHFVSVSLIDGSLTDISAPGVEDIYSGDFVGDFENTKLIGAGKLGSMYVFHTNGKFYKLGNVTGLVDNIVGFTWDKVTNKMYVATSDKLYELSNDYIATLVGTVTDQSLLGIACDANGNLFGITGTDNLVAINKTTGAATVVGPLGIDVDYVQDIGFDRTTNTLYGTLYLGGGTGGLYFINTNSGTVTQLGSDFQDELSVCAIYSKPQTTSISKSDVEATISVYPNPSSGVFQINAERSNLKILDISGKVISSQIIDGVETISIEKSGVYFLRFSNSKSIITKKVIVQ